LAAGRRKKQRNGKSRGETGRIFNVGRENGTSFCIGIPSLSRGDAVSQWGRSGFLLGLVKK
ncbi:hypothetical protein GWI33_009860, partial [Rhynchophorus ferrugineus]